MLGPQVCAPFAPQQPCCFPTVTIEFDGSASIDADGNPGGIIAWEWQFDIDGDGEDEERVRRARITLHLRRMRRSVKVTVKDNGPGIPEENRERVFEPFFTSKAGGSGLGLYLVREIALASGGALSLSSSAGRGTSISIRWPHADESGSLEA